MKLKSNFISRVLSPSLGYGLAFICFMLFASSDVLASSTGSTAILPYESWLMSFQKSLTGPVAFSVALIGIVASGITLILIGGEINGFIRAMIYMVLVMTFLIGANSLMTNFFHGASIGDVENVTEALVEKAEALVEK